MGSNVDPAAIRATAQRVVDEQRLPDSGWLRLFSDMIPSSRQDILALVQAGAELAEDEVTKHYDGVVKNAEREAARKAWDAAMKKSHGGATALWQARARDEYLAREYPETRECVLSDGSVVTYEAPGEVSAKPASMFVRRHRGVQADWWHDDWRVFAITGADFDKLKAFAEAVR